MIFKSYCNSIQPISDGCITWLYEYYRHDSDYFQKSAGQFVLNFKKKNLKAIEKVAEELIPQLDNDFAITVFPSSDTKNQNKTACHILAKKIIELCGSSKNIYDASECLYRVTDISSQHKTNKRSIYNHIETIIVKNLQLIKNKDVLVLDDVSTTGTSMMAAFEILKKHGAKTVIGFVVGRTIMNIPKYSFILDIDQVLFNTSYTGNKNYQYAADCSVDNNIYKFMKELDSLPYYSYCIVTSSPLNYVQTLINKLSLRKAKIFSCEDIDCKFPGRSDKTILLLKARNYLNSKNENLKIYKNQNYYNLVGAFSSNNYVIVIDNKYESLKAAKNLGMIAIGALWFSDPNTAEYAKVKEISDMYYTNITDFSNDIRNINSSLES